MIGRLEMKRQSFKTPGQRFRGSRQSLINGDGRSIVSLILGRLRAKKRKFGMARSLNERAVVEAVRHLALTEPYPLEDNHLRTQKKFNEDNCPNESWAAE
jgi:hypothetical protein